MTGQMTGGNPKTTGVFYDVEYNRALLPAGTTECLHLLGLNPSALGAVKIEGTKVLPGS